MISRSTLNASLDAQPEAPLDAQPEAPFDAASISKMAAYQSLKMWFTSSLGPRRPAVYIFTTTRLSRRVATLGH